MVNISFNRSDFCQYRDICVALKQMKSELLDIKSRCTVVDTVQDYSTGFPRTKKIEAVLQDKYRRQAAATKHMASAANTHSAISAAAREMKG